MNLCPGDKCPHYGQATKYPRKCYYEPQCWKGMVDMMVHEATVLLEMRK